MQNHCRQIKALTLHLLPNLRSREERDRKAAIIIFTEVGAWGAPQGQPAPHLQLNPPGPPLTNRFLTPCLPTPSSLGPTVRGSWLGLHVSGPSPPASWGTVFYSPSPDVMGPAPGKVKPKGQWLEPDRHWVYRVLGLRAGPWPDRVGAFVISIMNKAWCDVTRQPVVTSGSPSGTGSPGAP